MMTPAQQRAIDDAFAAELIKRIKEHENRYRIAELETAIRQTLTQHAHLADGEECTLKELKKVIMS
jgi:hypothetical protein